MRGNTDSSSVTVVETVRLLNTWDVANIFRVEPNTILRWVKQDKFPKPFTVADEGHYLWRIQTIQLFINQKERESLEPADQLSVWTGRKTDK